MKLHQLPLAMGKEHTPGLVLRFRWHVVPWS